MDPVQPPEEHELAALAANFLTAKIDRRQFLRRAAALGVSASAAGAFLAACSSKAGSGPSPSSAKKGGTMVYGPFADGQNYDPATNNFDYPNPPFPSIYEGLTAYNPTLPVSSAPQNLLAESLEKSSDGRRYYFKLKQGVEFHHGFGEMTASDVKFSWERDAGVTKLYKGAPKSAVSYYAGDFSGLEEVKVTGKYTGTVIFKEPFVPFETITLPWTTSGYIYPQKAVERYGASFAHHPVGTGPYEVVSYTPQQEMVLGKFSGYSGANLKLDAKNWFDEIRIKDVPLNAVPKGEALTVALQSGEVDFTPNLGALDVQRLSGNSAFKTYSPLAPLDYYFVSLDVQNPKLKDIRVRQAIRYALNIPEIISTNRLPESTRLPSLISKDMGVGYWAGAPVYQRDVSKAKALLAAAGATNLSLSIAAPLLAETPGEPQQVMQVIQSNLKDAGITVNIIQNPPNSYVSKAGFGEMTWTYYGGAPDPYYQFEWFQCSQVGIWNYASWCNKQYSDLLVRIGQTLGKSQRDAIAVEMQKLIDEAVSYTWISVAINFSASKADLVGVFDRNANPLLHYSYRV